ncbi:sensor histidine kinase [Deinococcus aquatilis]|uniref:sensor histidine kinase n=1 Tax=Deinococcus aquatilis TaxID=519440 RepID=UPI0003620001|nr:HAMP domain-containing sensor histidine kinase [Deinococcus aquatilis]
MTQRLSLRIKLTLGYALVFALTVLVGGGAVFLATRQVLTTSLDATLQETASVAQGSIERDNGRVRFTPELQVSGDLSIELLTQRGVRLTQAGQGGEESGSLSVLTLGLSTQAHRRVLTLAVPGSLLLRVSRPTDILTEFLETLGRLLLFSGAAMIAAACAAGYLLAHRALKPVDAVARTAQSIADQGDYAERVPQAPGHDEMARLTRTVNAMLDQLSSTIEREKQFARTAAHELRTPLTALKGRLDLTLDRPRPAEEYEKALLGMRGRVNALTELTESLLALARTDGPVTLQAVELAATALQVSEALEDAATQQGKRVRLDLEESWVQAEPEGVARAIRNLLENALKYGTGSEVWLRVQGCEVAVENSGPGPEPGSWPRLLQAFERGQGLQGVSGSGLGLALVSALTQRWHAALVPEWRSQTFVIRMQFPRDG